MSPPPAFSRLRIHKQHACINSFFLGLDDRFLAMKWNSP